MGTGGEAKESRGRGGGKSTTRDREKTGATRATVRTTRALASKTACLDERKWVGGGVEGEDIRERRKGGEEGKGKEEKGTARGR